MPKASWHQKMKRASKDARTTLDGITHDSVAEAERWMELKLQERAGLIRDLKRQVKFPFRFRLAGDDAVSEIKIPSPRYPKGRLAGYTADFTYVDVTTSTSIVEEYKGIDSGESRLRRAVTEAIYNIVIRVTGPAKRPARRSAKPHYRRAA